MIVHEKLPTECNGITHRVVCDGVKFYVETSEYSDGRLGGVAITISKPGNEMRLFDAIGQGMSIGLQRGIPLSVYVDLFSYQELGTGGITDDSDFPTVKSILDFVVRWLALKYPEGARALTERSNDV